MNQGEETIVGSSSQTSVEKLFAQYQGENNVNIISLVGNIKPLSIGFRSGKAQLEQPLAKYVAAKFSGSMDELKNLNKGTMNYYNVDVTVVNSKDEKIVNNPEDKVKFNYKKLIDVHKLTSQFAANRQSGEQQITDIDGKVNEILDLYGVDSLIFRSTTFNSSVNYSGSQLLFIYKKDGDIVNGSGYLYYVLSAKSIQGMLGRKNIGKGQSKVIIKPFTIKDNVINTEIFADSQGVRIVDLLKNLTGAPLSFGNPFGSMSDFFKRLTSRQQGEIVKEAEQVHALVKTGSDQDVVKSKSTSIQIWKVIVTWWSLLPFRKALIEKIQNDFDCSTASQAIAGHLIAGHFPTLEKFKNYYKTCHDEYKDKLMNKNGDLEKILQLPDYSNDYKEGKIEDIASQETQAQFNSIMYYAPDTEFYKMYMGYYEKMGSDAKIKESLCYWGQWWKSTIASFQTAKATVQKRSGDLLSWIGTYIPNVGLSKTIGDWGIKAMDMLSLISTTVSGTNNKAIANSSYQSQNSNLPSSVVEADDNDSGTNNNSLLIEEMNDDEADSEVIGNAMEQERQRILDPLSGTSANQERPSEVQSSLGQRRERFMKDGMKALTSKNTNVDNNDDNVDERDSTTNAPPVTTDRGSTPGFEMVPLDKKNAGGRKRKVTRKNSKKIKIASKSKKPKKIKGKRISIKKKFSKTKHKKK